MKKQTPGVGAENTGSSELTGLLTGQILPQSYTRPRYRATGAVSKSAITLNQISTVGGSTVMCTPKSALSGNLSSYAERLALTASTLQQRLLSPFAQQQGNGAGEAGVGLTVVQQGHSSGAVTGAPSLVISQAPTRLQHTGGAGDCDASKTDAVKKHLQKLTGTSDEPVFLSQILPSVTASLAADKSAQTAKELTIGGHPSPASTQKSFVLSQGGTLVPVSEGQRVIIGGAASSQTHFTLAGHATHRSTARLVSLCAVDHGARLSADSEQAIQKLQFHDFPLTTTAMTQSSSVLHVSQAALITRGQPSHTVTAAKTGQSIVATSGVKSGQAIVVTGSIASANNHSSIVSGGTVRVGNQTIVVSGGSAGKTGQSLMDTGGSGQEGGSLVGVTDSPVTVKIGQGGVDGRIVSFTSQVAKKPFVVSTSTGTTKPVHNITYTCSTPTSTATATHVATEPLGKVSSIVESPPGVDVISVSSSTDLPSTQSSVMTMSNMKTLPTASGSSGRGGRVGSAVSVSYVTTAKPVLPTVTSTRTRRIKMPKQYDL